MIVYLELKEKDVEFIASFLHSFNLGNKEQHKRCLKVGNEVVAQLFNQRNNKSERRRN